MRCRIAILIVTGFLAVHSNSFAQTAKDLSDTARGYFAQGNYNEAINLLQRSIQLQPLADSYYGLALCYVQTGALDKAAVAFERAATVDKYYVKGLYQLAQIYLDTESDHFNLDAAVEALEKAVSIDPTHADAQFKLG